MVFDNIIVVFLVIFVIVWIVIYIYVCVEWIVDVFKGKEVMFEIYFCLFNLISIVLVNYVVDLEVGFYVLDYFVWNFNSGMVVIDVILVYVFGCDDVLIMS